MEESILEIRDIKKLKRKQIGEKMENIKKEESFSQKNRLSMMKSHLTSESQMSSL